MPKFDLVDSLTLVDGSPKTTREGYMVVEARVARTGIQLYNGSELGLNDKGVIRVYRPEEEVFNDASMRTYAHRPITLNHPKGGVNSKNWKQLSVGQVGDEVIRDGESIKVPLVLMDQAAIDSVQAGIRELSMGYSCELEFSDGVDPSGQPYDAIQRNLKMNHLAIVANARGGSDLRIGDSTGEPEMTDPVLKTQTVVVDGLSIQTTEQGAQVIAKLQKQLNDAAEANAKLVKDHSVEMAKKDAELDSVKAKVIGDADLDKRVSARASLVETSKKIYPNLVADGKSDDAIRLEVVVAKFGDSMKGKDQSYINARFDILAEDSAKGTNVNNPGGYQQPQTNLQATTADQAYAESINSMSEAWKAPVKQQ